MSNHMNPVRVATRFIVRAEIGLVLGAVTGGTIGASYWALGLYIQGRLWDALHGYVLDGYGMLWGMIQLGCMVGGTVGLIYGVIKAFPPQPPASSIATPPLNDDAPSSPLHQG
jgi:hypothetical protein